MGQSTRNRVLWQGVSVLLYLAGLVSFLVVAVGAFLAPPEQSFANLTTVDLAVIVASLGMLVAGRLVGWRYGFGAEGMTRGHVAESMPRFRNPPEPTKLEELGYRVPPEPEEEVESNYAYEDGEVYVVCRDCGEQNETGFDYCSRCSAELPE